MEKYAILEDAEWVFVGHASDLHWTISFDTWRPVWAITGTVHISEMLRGPKAMEGKSIPYLFRCCACPLVWIPHSLHSIYEEPNLWFVAKRGDTWESAARCSGDDGVRLVSDRDDFKAAIDGDPYRRLRMRDGLRKAPP